MKQTADKKWDRKAERKKDYDGSNILKLIYFEKV